MQIELIKPGNSRALNAWMKLPWRIYKNDPNWIPHLKQDIEKVFDPEKNKLLKIDKETDKQGYIERWLLRNGKGEPIGRIAAFVNPKNAWENDQPTGGMGFFECIDDQQAANLLLDAARDWLKSKDMEAMDGPVNLGDRNMFWGLLIENFTDFPIYGTNYNPEYYRKLLEGYGFQLYYNQLFFKRSASLPAQPIFRRKYEQLQRDPDYRVADSVGRSIEQIAVDLRIVLNSAWVDHENFKPMEQATAFKLVNSMKAIIDRRLLIFVYFKEVPIAMYISVPEMNEIFRYVNGDLNWIGKLKFLYHKWRGTVKNITGIVFGVAKEYQGKGIEGALITFSEKQIVDKKLYKDTVLTWIGDFNPKMIKVCKNLGAENYRTLATFRYLFDRNKPFQRQGIIEEKKD
ncbi:MAG: hypothetical protein WAR83_11635 [Flavobacteriales bacterium]